MLAQNIHKRWGRQHSWHKPWIATWIISQGFSGMTSAFCSTQYMYIWQNKQDNAWSLNALNGPEDTRWRILYFESLLLATCGTTESWTFSVISEYNGDKWRVLIPKLLCTEFILCEWQLGRHFCLQGYYMDLLGVRGEGRTILLRRTRYVTKKNDR